MKIKVGFDSVELGQAALGEAPEGFDAVDMSAAVGKGLSFVDAQVLIVADIDQAIVTGPAIGADDALRVDPPPNDGPQSIGRAIVNDLRINLPLALEDAEDGLLERATAAQTRQRSAPDAARPEVTFIHFDYSSERPALAHPLQTDEQPEALVKGVDSLAIELQQPGRLRRRQIETKALHNFSDPIARQLAPFEHLG